MPELTVKDAATILAISERTVRRRLASGALVGRLVTGATGLREWRIDAASVRAATDAATSAARPMSPMREREAGELAELSAHILELVALTRGIDERLRSLEAVTERLALPPAKEPQPARSWWQRLWGKGS